MTSPLELTITEAPPDTCRSGDTTPITDTLREIADRDRRTSALLRGLSARMGSNQTAEMEAYLAGFERIEDGLAMLAMRMAETATAARMVPVETKILDSAATGTVMADTIRTKTSDDPFAIDDLLPVQPVAEVRSMATPERVASVEPVASVVHPVRSKPNPRAVGVDTFDIVESYPGDPADPWLPDGVDKLTEIYEADVGFAAKTLVMGSVDRGPAKAVASAPVKPEVIDAAPAVSAQPMMPLAGGMVGMIGNGAAETTGIDRVWLEQRLGDLAHQIEHSFTFSRSDAQFEAIGQRMSAIETEIAALAARPSVGTDATKLAAFDQDLQAIAGEFEAARSELSRLRTIEDQLSALIEHVDEGGIAAAVDKVLEARLGQGGTLSASAAAGSMVGGYTEVEVQQFAMAAAEAAVAKMVASGQELGSAAGATDAALRVDSMQAMLAGYIQDRRAGDDQNALAIDALQQAMLRVLDRLDEIEGLVAQQAIAIIEPNNDGAAQALAALDEADIRPAFGKRESARDVVRDAAVAPMAEAAPKVAVDTAMVARTDKTKAEPKLPDLPEPVAPSPVAALDEREEAALDPIARQRLKLQASAQRAAEAQRLKQDEQERNAPVGLSAKLMRMLSGKSRGAKAATPPPIAPSPAGGRGDNRRVLVSAIALAVVLGFGATMVVTQLSETTQVATVEGGEAGSATVAAASGSAASDATNATVSRAAVDGAIVDDGKTQLVSTGTAETPLSGIVIGNGAAVPGATSVGATSIGSGAANPTPATELPPATVGPLSLRLAAAQGDPSAEFEVATRLAEGKGTDQNFVEASKWYQRAASRGFAQAQYRLATLYERGLGVKADMGRAKSWYQRAAEQGNVKAMHNLAVLAAGRSGGAPDYAAAATWFTQAANHGLADSQYNLAVLTESGTGIQKDPVQAATWFILAARAGDREALRRRDQVKARLDANAWAAAEKQAAEWQPMVPSKLANDARFAGEQWKSRTADAGQNG